MLRSFSGAVPKIDPSAFVHDSAELIGRVVVGRSASVWPGCVLRGDIDRIVVGERANVQDLTVIHTRHGQPTIIGRGVTVGHRVILHGCRIGAQALIGMGAIVMEATIGARALIGAGALIPAGMKVPPGTLVLGSPGRVARRLRPDELRMLAASEREYVARALMHARGSRPVFGR